MIIYEFRWLSRFINVSSIQKQAFDLFSGDKRINHWLGSRKIIIIRVNILLINSFCSDEIVIFFEMFNLGNIDASHLYVIFNGKSVKTLCE